MESINNKKDRDNIYGDNYLFGWTACTSGQIGSYQIPAYDDKDTLKENK